jgi:uncharacterized membrane protein YfcA
MMTFEILAMYFIVGIIAGVLSGLLGIGGGVVIVPMLVYCFTIQAVRPDTIMHLALGTSLASIIFTSISSCLAHHWRGAVDWEIVWRFIPGILTGTFAGTFLASNLSTGFLKGFFSLFLFIIATQISLNKKPKATRDLPASLGMFSLGSGIGAISALVGIGGGSISTFVMLLCNVPTRRAIGTSATIGIPVAIAGTIGYILNNLNGVGLPPYSLGYVYLPALCTIVLSSVFSAPLGVKLAHSLPVDKLRRILAFFLYLIGVKMVWSLFM